MLYERWFWIPTILLGSFFIVVNLPQPRLSIAKSGSIKIRVGEFPENYLDEVEEVEAGWPYAFYWKQSVAGDGPMSVPIKPLKRFDRNAAAKDLLIAVASTLVMSILLCFMKRRQHRDLPEDQHPAHESGHEADLAGNDLQKSFFTRTRSAKVRVSIADLLLVTLVIALPFGFFNYEKNLAERESNLIASMGDASFEYETIVPKYFYEYLSSFLWRPALLDAMKRVTAVSLQHPKDDAIDAAMQLSQLRKLSVCGGKYDLQRLSPISTMQRLKVLHLTGRPINNETIAHIRGLPNLQCLDFNRTNVTAESLDRFYRADDLGTPRHTRLRELFLVDTAVELGALAKFKVLDRLPNLRIIVLPRPSPGSNAKFELNGHPTLEVIRIDSLDRPINSKSVSVHLEALPKLRYVSFDATQKFSLDFKALPLLDTLGRYDFYSRLRVSPGQSVPDTLWFDSINLTDCPSLPLLNFYGGEMQYYRTTGTPNLNSVGIGVFRRGMRSGDGAPSQFYQQDIPISCTNAIIEGISRSDGPKLLDYSAVSISQADLTPLYEDDELTDLFLHQCGLTASDFEGFIGNKTLKNISSMGTNLSGKQLSNIINGLESLHRWHADLVPIKKLRIEDHQQIRGLVDVEPESKLSRRTHLPTCEALRLVNLPNWTDAIRLDHPKLVHLTIEDLPKLKSLTVNTPLSLSAVLSGLDGLEHFAGGGEYLDDELIVDVCKSTHLGSLCLLKSSVTDDGFSEALAGKSLVSLVVPSSNISDQSIDSMNLQSLAVVDISDTNVTVAGVRKIIQSPSLSKLNIAGIAIDAETSGKIAGIDHLQELVLDAGSLTSANTRSLASNAFMMKLGFSNLVLDENVASAISVDQTSSVRLLTLIDSEVKPAALKRLMRELPELQLNLVDTMVPALLEAELFEAGRLYRRSEDETPYVYIKGGPKIAVTSQQQSFFFGFQNGKTAPMPDELFEDLEPERFDAPEADLFWPEMVRSIFEQPR